MLVQWVVIGLLNLLPLSVHSAPTFAPPTGPYISLHAFPGLAEIRAISVKKPSVKTSFSKRLSTYQRPSHFNPTNSNSIPDRGRVALPPSGESAQGGWHW